MFAKLAGAKHLRAQVEGGDAVVGFAGRTERIRLGTSVTVLSTDGSEHALRFKLNGSGSQPTHSTVGF